MNKKMLLILLSGISLSGIISGCTSYANYSYAIEGNPAIGTPTQFPALDESDVSYSDKISLSETKFYNSYWFDTNKSSEDTSKSDFLLVSKYNINYLVKNYDAKVQINGYASELGSKKLNENLSLKRANFIKDYMIKNGVDQSQISVKGYGNTVLTYSSTNDKNNPSNRRVDVLYKNLPPANYSDSGNSRPIVDISKSIIEVNENNAN